MSKLLSYEDFSPVPQIPDPQNTALLSETARLGAYEEGYKAGWDDAAGAEAANQTRIGADFARSLQDLSFSYHEARAHVLSAIGPLLELMAEKVLPEIARDHFAQTVLEQVRTIAGTAADAAIELVVNPDNRAALEKVMPPDPGLPLTIIDEPSLGPGQAYLRGAKGECQLDQDAVLSGIRAAVSAFLSTSQEQVTRHG
ncbi:flagellar biosynthesis protein [Actibacterium sp.]|uniref:FliH/SctL family protein n=1 Tax=Actibacterium sp. TaxID=1872125 RepID=UPI0035630B36